MVMQAPTSVDYRQMMEEGFAFDKEHDLARTRHEYLSNQIFNFTTYDSDMDKLFVSKALAVCEAISSGKTFDFIKDEENYRWYLLMVNTTFFADKLNWGGSIRGAWWDEPVRFGSCGLWLDGVQHAETMIMTRQEWGRFIAAVLDFARSGD